MTRSISKIGMFMQITTRNHGSSSFIPVCKAVFGIYQKIVFQNRVDELKGRILDNEEKAAHAEVKVGSGSNVAVRCEEEDSDIENRRNNVIMYKVKEIESEVAEDRKAGDMLFVHELCNDVLKVEVGSGDIEKMFRLGRREQGKERPLLVRFTRVEKKHEVMGKLKELKTASERYRITSIAHDLTPRQREVVKELRKKALDELEAENGTENDAAKKGENYRIIVVGQQTSKPRAIRVPIKD